MGFAERISQKTLLEFVQKNCQKCGLIYYIPTEFNEYRIKNRGVNWWCPGCGDRWYYVGETEEEKLKRQLREEHRLVMQERERIARLQADIRAKDEGMRKLRNRIALGICPCCNRSFGNLSNHMAQKHPDYAERQGLKADDYRDALIMSHCREWSTTAEIAERFGYPSARGIAPTMTKLRKQGLVEVDWKSSPVKWRVIR